MLIRKKCTETDSQERYYKAIKNGFAKFSIISYFPLLKGECYIEQCSYIKNAFPKCKDCVGFGIDVDVEPCNKCDEFSNFKLSNLIP